MRDLEHITLNTGHTRRSPRSEVGPGIVEALRPILERALTGTPTPIPPGQGYTLTGGVRGRCASFTVWSRSLLIWPEDDQAQRAPVVEIGVAGHSRCGAPLWRTLHALAARLDLPVKTDPGRCPPEPWCAALLYPGAVLAPDAMDWLGDFERCLAWAWLASRHPPAGVSAGRRRR